MLDQSDISRITATRPLFTEQGDAVTELFYDRVFELAPDVREIFPDNLAEQARKLSATLAVAISSLDEWDELAPVLASLARRHIVYGVEPWHYAIVTQALLDTLSDAKLDAPTIQSWARAMSAINAHMIASAYTDQRGLDDLNGVQFA
jgi:nitric oxide dioxygenase